MHLNGVGRDNIIHAVAQLEQTEMLLKKANNQPHHKPNACPECRDEPTFVEENATYLLVGCAEVAEDESVLLLINHQHGERTHYIERSNQENKHKQQGREQFLYLHDAEEVGLLFVAVLHPEVVAEERLDAAFCVLRSAF